MLLRRRTIIFGGGPVVIPLLNQYIVGEGWVSSRDFLLGLAIIQAFPGPNFNCELLSLFSDELYHLTFSSRRPSSRPHTYWSPQAHSRSHRLSRHLLAWTRPGSGRDRNLGISPQKRVCPPDAAWCKRCSSRSCLDCRRTIVERRVSARGVCEWREWPIRCRGEGSESRRRTVVVRRCCRCLLREQMVQAPPTCCYSARWRIGFGMGRGCTMIRRNRRDQPRYDDCVSG